MIAVETLLNRLEPLRQQCEATMQAYAGETGFCQLHKAGKVTGGLKYQEGRLVVFSTIIRQVKQLPPAEITPALNWLLTAEMEKWQTQLHRHQAEDRPALTWVVYSQGGVDAVAEIRQMLQPG